MSKNDFWSLVEKEKKKKFGVNSGLNLNTTPTGEFGEMVKEYKFESSPFVQAEDIAPVKTTVGSKDDGGKLDFFQKGAFEDGYQFGDVTKSLLGTVGDVGLEVVRGFASIPEGVADAVANYIIAPVADVAGADDFADRLREATAIDLYGELTQGADDYLEKYSLLGRTSDSIVKGVGQIGTIIGTGGLGASAGLGSGGVTALTTGVMGVSGMGSGSAEAYSSGAETGEAELYGLISGGADALSELMFGGLGKSVNALGFNKGLLGVDDLLAKKVSSLFSNQIAKNLAEYGIKASAEGVEEVVAGMAQALGKKLTYMSEEDLGKIIEDENLLEQFVVGIGASGVAQGSSVHHANKTNTDYITGFNQDEQAVVKKETENRIAVLEKDGRKLTAKEKSAIEAQVEKDLDKGYISIDTIESALGGDTYKTYRETIDSEDALQQEFDALYKMKQGDMTGEQIDRRDELKQQLKDIQANSKRGQLQSQLSEEVFTRVKDSRLVESYNEKARRSQAFAADLTKYDAKQRTVIQNAIDSGILNNTNRTHEFVDMVARISADKGVLFDFTNNAKLKESGFAKDGMTVNGYVTKDGVTVNIQAAKSLNSVVGHEIAHVLEGTEFYTELQNSIIEYAKAKGDYQGRYDSLAKLYENIEGADINSELTADLVGDYLFTDPDFINNLSTNHRNVFQKIYDEVKYLCKIATAGSKEARELEKVKRAFEKAYRENVNTETDAAAETEFDNDDVQYSISVTDKNTLDDLNEQVSRGEYDPETNPNGGYYVTYKSMSFWGYDENGNAILRSPMAEYVDGELSNAYLIPKDKSKLNWYQATETIDEKTGLPSGLLVKTKKPGNKSYSYVSAAENPDLIAEDWSNLYFNLKKKVQKNGKWVDSDVPARYNPYEHSSNSMLNDQFSTAYLRDNLVTVKMYVPMSEDNGAYRAQWSKDATGWADWKSGTVAGKINQQKDLQRRVYLSRYAAPVEIVPDSEVAQAYKEYIEGTDVSIPDNVVSPGLLSELRKAGVPITESGKVKYSLTADTNGNQLSKAQKEYFKDSKVVDESGNLKVMYHGTSTGGHTVFDPWGKGRYGLFGVGIYFTDSKNIAESYTKKGKGTNPQVYESYLNIKNPMDMDAPADRDAWAKQFPDAMFPESGTNEDFYRAMEEYFEDEGMVRWEAEESAMDAIWGMGYDGITHIGGGRVNPDGERHRVYIAFDPEQVKNTDNKNPTSDPDIRYSLSDSEGKQLTKEQQDYFKDSKMRDADGNLKVMYHGSQNGGFHVFDPDYSDDDISLFFVDRNEVAMSYSGTSETYAARTFRTAEDFNKFFAEIGATEYEVKEKDGKLHLYEDGDLSAVSSTGEEIYEEFRDLSGLGYGDVNYKVYLNLTNPLVVDARGRYWNAIHFKTPNETIRFEVQNVNGKWKIKDNFNGDYLEIDRAVAWVTEKYAQEALDDYVAKYPKSQGFGKKVLNTTRDVAQYAKSQGYDGVIFNNINDNGGFSNGSEGASTVAIAFNSNQVKSTANVKPTGDPDIRYSLSEDSQGRVVSKELQDQLQFSKVRDDSGHLIPMYHGTPNGSIAQFKAGTYFTDNKEYADRYQNPSASSISSGKTVSDPKTFEVYLDIRKPFDIANDAEARRIYIEEYIKGGNAIGVNPYLSDSEYAKINTIDWTEGEDLRDFLTENGYDYDGLVLDEGADGGYGEEVKYRGKSYVIFNPEQAVSVDRNGDSGVRYSLNEDSTGKKLSAEQSEFFKDSVIRDENGKLMPMYHGTHHGGFTVFGGRKDYWYFSNDRKYANIFAGRKANGHLYPDTKRGIENGHYRSQVYAAYLNVKNPFVTDDVDIIEDALYWDKSLAGKLREKGYDALMLKDMSQVIVLNPNQIKNISNKKPSTDSDIRYSLSAAETDKAYLDAVSRGDADGIQKMVKDAAEMSMPNSKVRDSNGNLRLVYHGRVSEFNVFDRQYSSIEGDFGKGYYFTSSESDVDRNYANEDGPDLRNKIQRYAEQLEFEDEYADLSDFEREEIARKKFVTSEPNTVTAYLNMENPVYITPNEKGTFLDFEENYDEESDEYGEPEGLLIDFVEALERRAQDFDTFGSVDFSFLYEYALDNGGMYAADAVKTIKHRIIDEITDENGDIAVNEVIRLAFEDIGFDGIIDSSVSYKFSSMSGMDSETTHYIVFDSNQIKSADFVTYDDDGNVIPLSKRFNAESNDIRYSLSKEGEQQPVYGKYNVYGKDIALEGMEEVAPVPEAAEESSPTQATISETETVAPVVVAENETTTEMFPDDLPSIDEELDNLLQQKEALESRMTEALNAEDYDAFAKVNDEYNSLMARLEKLEQEAADMDADRLSSLDDSNVPPEAEAPYPGEPSKPWKTPDPFADRDMTEVGKRSVKAYMYENPEVKPFFQEAAYGMLDDLHNGTKGEKIFNDQVYYDSGGEKGWMGTTRSTTADIADLLDNWHYTYAEIEKGLNAIIEDNGAENNAVSKRIEFMLDDRLRNGYTGVWGEPIPRNEDYIRLLEEKQINEYGEEAFRSYLASLGDDLPPEAYGDDIAPMADGTVRTAAPAAQEDIAPTREYEAIRPQPKKQPRMVRVDGAKKSAETSQVAKVLSEEPKTAKRKSRAWSRFVANFGDKGNVFETLSLKTKNRELQARYNSLHYADGKAQSLIGKGAEGVKSLNSIVEEVNKSGKTEKFYEYLYHMHNVDRMTLEGRYKDTPNKAVFGDSVTADMSRVAATELAKKNPEFRSWAQDVYRYNAHLRKLLVDGGVISQETAQLWSEMYPHYVPIRRAGDDGLNINVPLDTRKTGVNAPIKKATGGSRDILPLFDTMAQRTIQTYKAIAKNRFGVELKNTLGTTVARDKVSVDGVIDGVDQHESLLQEGKNGNNPTFTVFENGEKVTFEISDDMYDALKPTSEGLAYTNKAANFVSNFRRGLLTEYNPTFMVTNAIKDAQDVLINSQHPVRTYAAFPKAIQQLATKGNWYSEYIANGGEQNTYFDKEENAFEKKKSTLSKVIGAPLEAISAANNFIERIPRLAEYIASREAGRSIDVSMLDAARVTTNFAAGGDVTKFLNRNGATFLNASVQGFMQNVRNVREAKANGLKGVGVLATKFAAAGFSALLLNSLLWDDDDEYEELSDYVKQNYYIVGKYGDGQFVRIPKGRMMAVIQNAFEQAQNALTGEDEIDLQTFAELFISNLAPNNPLDNNIISPIIQVAQNKTWYGDDLVPTRLEDLPAAEQFDETTDSISRWLGEKLNVSPVKINYMLDQYSGGLGDTFLPMLTPAAERGDDSVEGNLIAPLKDKFTTDGVLKNQGVSDFYDKMDELTTKAKASKATDSDVLSYKYMNSVNAELSELYAKKREIQNSNLADGVKYSQVREIQRQINAIAKDSLNTYGNVSISGGYATVGDIHYRKNNGEWQKITDKQLENQEAVTSGLGISPNEYWSNKEEYDYAYDNPEKYAVAKSVGGYEAYKTYSGELYDIKADKDASGKSISGSRKNKVIDYINSLDADYGEKLILFKSEYNADDTYNAEIVEYLNGRDDLSYEDRIAILKELGFTVTADGRATWD